MITAQLDDLPLWLNLILFGAGALAIWFAGVRLSRFADVIAARTGVARAFIGAILLGGITSLPEGATTITASAIGNAPLAVNNIFGGVAMQVAILAVADIALPGPGLTSRIREPVVLLQGMLLVLILTVAAAAMTSGEVALAGVGTGSAAIFAASTLAFYLIHQHPSRDTWTPEAQPREPAPQADRSSAEITNEAQRHSTRRVLIYTGLAALVILIAGFVVAKAGDVLAEQTGLGASFVGFLFVAVATSLPEASTTLSAIRLGRHGMAFSNIFGANILDLSLLFLADIVFPGGPVLSEVGRFSLFGALLGIGVTTIYLIGLLEKRKRRVLGAGIDSHLVLLLYAAGMYLLYTMR